MLFDNYMLHVFINKIYTTRFFTAFFSIFFLFILKAYKNKLLIFFNIYTKDKNKYLKTLRIIFLYFYKNNNNL